METVKDYVLKESFKQGMDANALVEKAGIALNTFNGSHYYRVSKKTLFKLTQAVDLDIDKLFELNHNMPTQEEYLENVKKKK